MSVFVTSMHASMSASTILQLLNTEWHQIEGLLPASPSAASAVVTLLAMLSPKDLASATGLVSSALPILLKQQCNEQSMRDGLSKAIANAVRASFALKHA